MNQKIRLYMFFDSQIHSLYKYMVDFLGDPVLYKIKDDTEHSFFGVQVFSDNFKEKQFLICKTMKKETSEIKLSKLPWFSLQTRKISDRSEFDDLKKIHLNKNFDSNLKHVQIEKVRSEKNVVHYQIPNQNRVKISLLHADEYYNHDKTNLQYLINLFDCIIVIERKKN